MRLLLLTTALLLFGLCLASATSTELLTQGRASLADGDPVTAEQLFQQIVEAPDAEGAEVEEALFWQLMIYSGDFLSAMALLQPLQAAHPEDHILKRKIAQQMGLSRWAFFVASGNYLNSTAMGQSLESISISLPQLGQADVDMLLATLASPEVLGQLLSDYDSDPDAAEGLIVRVNEYSMYLAVAEALPGLETASVEQIRSRIKAGAQFNQLHFYDWVARVALDMDHLVNEPNGPNLKDIRQRSDERILKLAAGDPNNKYANEARSRKGQ